MSNILNRPIAVTMCLIASKRKQKILFKQNRLANSSNFTTFAPL